MSLPVASTSERFAIDKHRIPIRRQFVNNFANFEQSDWWGFKISTSSIHFERACWLYIANISAVDIDLPLENWSTYYFRVLLIIALPDVPIERYHNLDVLLSRSLSSNVTRDLMGLLEALLKLNITFIDYRIADKLTDPRIEKSKKWFSRAFSCFCLPFTSAERNIGV